MLSVVCLTSVTLNRLPPKVLPAVVFPYVLLLILSRHDHPSPPLFALFFHPCLQGSKAGTSANRVRWNPSPMVWRFSTRDLPAPTPDDQVTATAEDLATARSCVKRCCDAAAGPGRQHEDELYPVGQASLLVAMTGRTAFESVLPQAPYRCKAFHISSGTSSKCSTADFAAFSLHRFGTRSAF